MFRVAGSNVRMPRSHSTMSVLPCCAMYSAAISHSSTVAERPRFNITGFPLLPTSFSNEKFCMLRAPTFRASATSATWSTSPGSMTSVTTGRPVSARHAARISNPIFVVPWNE